MTQRIHGATKAPCLISKNNIYLPSITVDSAAAIVLVGSLVRWMGGQW